MSTERYHPPELSGRVVAVTGATAGIGYFAAEQLAARGARVVLLGRSPERLARARRVLGEHVPGAVLDVVPVDLAELRTISAAIEQLAGFPALDGVFLNAGPDLTIGGLTADGLPMQLGTHAVGNAVLAEALVPLLSGSVGGDRRRRLVFASTGFVRRFRPSLDDLFRVPRFGPTAYVKAKSAMEVYAYELDRRLRAAETPVEVLVTVPGVGVDSRTPPRPGLRDADTAPRPHPAAAWAQGKDAAAWPGVRALTDVDATGGECFGPTGALRGDPTRLRVAPHTAFRPDAGRIADELLERGRVSS